MLKDDEYIIKINRTTLELIESALYKYIFSVENYSESMVYELKIYNKILDKLMETGTKC